MSVLGWLTLLVIALGVVLVASMRAINHVHGLTHQTRVPPFFLGITLLAVGTDLPEIANSVVSCLAGHGDLAVGDSIGSAVTQATLVLGLFPLLCGAIEYRRTRVFVVTAASAAAMALGILLMRDGFLSRLDGTLLIIAWIVGSVCIWKVLTPAAEPEAVYPAARPAYEVVAILMYLAAVGVGATLAVTAFVRLSPLLGVPEYVLSFFVASIGTSLPELVLDVTALRRGLRDVALGDVLGSTFVDSSLSIGIGPLVAPTAVTASLAILGSSIGIAAMFLVALVLGFSNRHTRASGSLLLLVYAIAYLALFS